MPARDAEGSALRAKYLDWCSARIAERFLELSPEQIYELALGEGGGGIAPVAGGGASAPRPAELDLSYRRLVERVTEVLAARLDLPEFAVWAESYRTDPGRYDAELLGFWRGAEEP